MCWESGKIHTQTPQPRRDIAPRQVWGVFFFVSHSFSPETKKRHQISLDGHKTKAIPIFNVVVFIHFPSKKACPKSSAAPFRQNRPLSFRNHRSEAPADSGYILLKSDRIFNQSRSGIFPSICAPSLFLFPVFSLFLTLLNSTAEKI